MNASALRVEWDDSKLSEIEEAKALYRKARAEHRIITDLNGNPIEGFRSWFKGFLIKEVQLTPDQFSFRIFDETGDRRLIWDAADPFQIKEAQRIFEEYSQRGWKAYLVDEAGVRGRRIYGFDFESEEIFFDERKQLEKAKQLASKFPDKPEIPKAEKLRRFVEKVKQVKMLPKTFPG